MTALLPVDLEGLSHTIAKLLWTIFSFFYSFSFFLSSHFLTLFLVLSPLLPVSSIFRPAYLSLFSRFVLLFPFLYHHFFLSFSVFSYYILFHSFIIIFPSLSFYLSFLSFFIFYFHSLVHHNPFLSFDEFFLPLHLSVFFLYCIIIFSFLFILPFIFNSLLG